MWVSISRFIIRKRFTLLIVLGLLTAVMAYTARKAELSYEFAQILPMDDPDFVDYIKFKEMFGEDGSVLVVGIEDKNIFQLDQFNDWYDLGNEIREMEGIREVVSIARIYNVSKNDTVRKFDFNPVFASKPTTQAELDSLSELVYSLPFYNNLLYNKETGATLMAITLDKKILFSKDRVALVQSVKERADAFSKKYNVPVHYSGLPYIRTMISKKIAAELELFLFLAGVVTAFILFLFFRSFTAVLFSMLTVGVGVIWSIATIVILGYKITILTGLIPPLIIVIGVPNCIFLLNKYHTEFTIHGNKIKALTRTIQRIGKAALMTNATTAVGFVAFAITKSAILREFGVVASINILIIFLLALILIPIIFSYLPEPSTRHTKHLENKRMKKVVGKLDEWVHYKRRYIYVSTFIVVAVAIIGVTRIKAEGYIVDDLPQKDPIYQDLKFFENNFKGVMPFEITIDTHKKNGIMNLPTMRRVDELQQLIAEYPHFSKPVSIAEIVKFSTQAYYNGNESQFRLPNDQEKNFILSYVPRSRSGSDMLKSLVDSTRQVTRISVQMADIGSAEIEQLLPVLKPRIDSIFNPEKYDVKITGTSIIFLKGTKYLVQNLIVSLIIAVFVIALLMSLMFNSFRMVVISLIPNIIPLLFTASIMGYFDINLKPSTILIFSIAFGISVDNTIHFLAKYRLELKSNYWNIGKSVTMALKETGVSMIYTSIVLFFGFSIFTASHFGGTIALGLLVSITLFVALLSNLLLLPSLLMSLEKAMTAKALKEPLIDIYDEEEDIQLEDLEIKRNF